MGVCQKCAGIDKTRGAKQLCFIHFLSLFLSLFFPPSSHPSLPRIGCEYPASEKSDQTDSQGSVSQRHRGCQSMLVPSCPTMHRARPTLLLLPLLLVLGLFLHLADAQSKWTVGFITLGSKCRPPPGSRAGQQGRKCCLTHTCFMLQKTNSIFQEVHETAS